MTIRLPRFTRLLFLKRIRRELLRQFFDRFQPGLAAGQADLPGLGLEDAAYYDRLARLLAAPERLPGPMLDALSAIEELSGPEGQEQLELALARAGRQVEFAAGATRQELALAVWLADAELVARAHTRQRLSRLTRFECFGCGLPAAERPALAPPGAATLQALNAALDPWFARHQRGRNTTRVDLCQPARKPVGAEAEADAQAEEYWFVVRHGDTFAREPSVDEQQTEILHFRPEKDDVVVYVPELEELRINARTRGERELYARQFGKCLRGREDWFSDRAAYTLEPLRSEGEAALDATGLEGVRRVTLKGLEVALPNAAAERFTHEAEDLFLAPPAGLGCADRIPREGRLARATFEFHFAPGGRPRPVQVRPPNVLKVGRRCDLALVGRFLSRRGFRVGCPPPRVEIATGP